MKNLKTYEKFFTKSSYNSGDYVIIKYSVKGKRYEEKEYSAKIEHYNQITYLYLVRVFTLNDFRWVYQKDIIRMMTPEEIEKLEIELNLQKYNL